MPKRDPKIGIMAEIIDFRTESRICKVREELLQILQNLSGLTREEVIGFLKRYKKSMKRETRGQSNQY